MFLTFAVKIKPDAPDGTLPRFVGFISHLHLVKSPSNVWNGERGQKQTNKQTLEDDWTNLLSITYTEDQSDILPSVWPGHYSSRFPIGANGDTRRVTVHRSELFNETPAKTSQE